MKLRNDQIDGLVAGLATTRDDELEMAEGSPRAEALFEQIVSTPAQAPVAAGQDRSEGSERRTEIGARIAALRPRQRALAALCAVLLLAGALLTAPGRSASAWVGELVGIGEVGGSPTQQPRPEIERSTPVVIDNGEAPDGTRYEWVTHRCEIDLSEVGEPTSLRGIGIRLEWPGVARHEGDGGCGGIEGEGEGKRAIGSLGVNVVPSQQRGVPEPDVVVYGSTGAEVHRTRVIYRDPDGRVEDLPVDFARVDGELLERTDWTRPLGTFVAFISGARAADDELETRFDLRARLGTGKLQVGPIAQRERRAAHAAYRECAPLYPGDPYDECLRTRMPPSPIEIVTYDEQGRELERESMPLIIPGLDPPQPGPAGRERPGAERLPRPASLEPTYGKPVVLMTGRAPDGALYEFFVQRFAEPDENVAGACLTLWWPYVVGAPGNLPGYCGGSGFPPETAFGLRNPENVVIKQYGSLEQPSVATGHLNLRGFARPYVTRVRVLYMDPEGDWRDAPVDYARVTGDVAERLDADKPFGYWLTFIPPSVAEYYGPDGGRAVGAPAIQVIAYGRDGQELDRIKVDH